MCAHTHTLLLVRWIFISDRETFVKRIFFIVINVRFVFMSPVMTKK